MDEICDWINCGWPATEFFDDGQGKWCYTHSLHEGNGSDLYPDHC